MTKKDFISICQRSEMGLKKHCKKRLRDAGYKTLSADGYLLAVPSDALPVCVVAHLDTVHKALPRHIITGRDADGKTIISAGEGIGADDRAGVFIILSLIENGLRPVVILTESEEIGCIGASHFVQDLPRLRLPAVNYMIEFDRANASDAVYYDCDNKDFTAYINGVTGYKTANGSYTDICEIAPALDVSAVNLSCGYYGAHTKREFVVWDEMINTISTGARLLSDARNTTAFEYIERKRIKPSYNWLYDYSAYDDAPPVWGQSDDEFIIRWNGARYYLYGATYEEAIGDFLMRHPSACYSEIRDEYL